MAKVVQSYIHSSLSPNWTAQSTAKTRVTLTIHCGRAGSRQSLPVSQAKQSVYDNISTIQQLQHIRHEEQKWLLALYNYCLTMHRLPTIWNKVHITALLKPGKDPSVPIKNYRPISLSSHTYNIFKRLILNRVGPDHQVGFCPVGRLQLARYSI